MSKQFSLQFIGTGNAWSKPPVNYNTNAIIRVDDHAWLLDCGLLCPLGLHNLGVPVTALDGAFITHLHGDHVAGLEELLFVNVFMHHRKIHLFLPSDFCAQDNGSDIRNNCLRAAMETALHGVDHMLTLDDYAIVHTLNPMQSAEIFGLPCSIFPTEHAGGHPAFGLILDGRIAYTSDSKFSLKNIESWLNNGIQTIFHEVTFTPRHPHAIHTSFEDLSTLPLDFAQHIILMHYGDKTTREDFERAEALGFRLAKPGSIYEF